MPNSTNPQPTPSDPSVEYGPVFARYLVGALRQSLAQVRAHRYTVPEDVRTQAWHIARLTLDVDALWEQTSKLLIELAPRMEMAGFRQDWIPYLEAGIARSEEMGDELSQAKLLYYLGQLYRMMGLYDEASDFLDKSEAVYIAHDKGSDQAVVLNEKAFITFRQGDYPDTEELAERAIGLFDDEHPERAMSYYHLGRVTEKRADLNAARRHYEAALEIRRTNDDKRWIAGGLRNLGIIYTWEKRYDKALDALEEAMQIHDSLSDPARKVSTLISMGILYKDTKRYRDAIACYHQARDICEYLSSQDSLAVIYNNLGMTYKNLEQWQDAVKVTETAINFQKLVNNPYRQANAMDTLGEIYMAQGKYQKALDVYEEAIRQIQDLPDVSSTRIHALLNSRIEELQQKLGMRA